MTTARQTRGSYDHRAIEARWQERWLTERTFAAQDDRTLPKAYVLEALDRHVGRGAIVLCTTTSTADAMLLGGQWLCVELGRVRADGAQPARLGFGPWQQLLVEASDAQSLALLLHASPHGLATELGGEPTQLKVTGPALDVTVRCASMRRSSFVLEFKATERAAGRLVAEARKVLVHYDYAASRSLALPPQLRELLKAQDPDVKEEAAP
jgi:hypothetical protein